MNDHSHDARELTGVAPEDHDHSYMDVHGAAHEHHSHNARDIAGGITAAQFRELQAQVASLSEQTSKLAAQLLAEREVGAAVAQGANTAELIADAIERRATIIGGRGEIFLGTQLHELAKEIREAASR